MLSWVGKRPLREVRTYPAQLIERFSVDGHISQAVNWSDWPARFDPGGLLFHGDNKEVLAYLLASGFRGKVDLVYIDPPFDSGADYVRRVQLRGASGTARLDGESYTLGEQIQYTDIWANDNYLQFMYERLLLLKELLAADSNVVLHTDYHKTHHLRSLMDEVFGPDSFVNELVWHYPDNFQGNVKGFASNHDLLLWYGLGNYSWTKLRKELEKTVRRPTRIWDAASNTLKLDRDDSGNPIYRDYTVSALDDVLEIPQRSVVVPGNADYTGYPTAKPPNLIGALVGSLSRPNDIVLDAFVGSGTTAAVAQKAGRRWIGCDINKGAIQTTEKRVLEIMRAQAAASNGQQRLIEDDVDTQPAPAQFAFTVYRVNDYDLQIQHNEAVTLAVEHLGVHRLRTDSFFDGIRGKELVKIVAFDHPLTPLDLQAIEDELRARPQEERDILVVALGKELAADVWLADYGRRSPVNKIRAVELRTDPKYGGFFEHRPASARVELERQSDGRVQVVIKDFMSPSIIERLRGQEGVLSPQIEDWRWMVDSVMIDSSFDGVTFEISLADIPERKADVVAGNYDFDVPGYSTVVAVRITDMLGEEVLTLLPVEQHARAEAPLA